MSVQNGEDVDMSDGHNEVPNWLKPKLSSDKLRQSNYIKEWLLRSPTHSRAAWSPFLVGTGIFLVLMYEHIAYSLLFDFVNEGGIFASTCLLNFYGAELLPQQLRTLAVIVRIVGICAGILLLICIFFGKYGLLWLLRLN